MTYASTQKILASDFTSLVSNGSNIGDHWGTGNGRHGLGQSVSAYTVPSVTAASKVFATQWTGLFQAINKCLTHEGEAAIVPASAITGNPITAYASVTAASAAAYLHAGKTALPLSSSAPSVAIRSSPWGSSSAAKLIFTQTVTFDSADAARYFFNAGGTISLSYAHTGPTTLDNSAWTTLTANTGTISFGYQNTKRTGGAGSPSAQLDNDDGGYWHTEATPPGNLHFKLRGDTGLPNYGDAMHSLQLEISKSGTDSIPARNGHPTIVFTTTLQDITASTSATGSTTASLVINSPATTYLTNSWLVPTITNVVTVTA